MNLGEKIKNLRLKKKLTLRELSEKVNLKANTLSQIENEKRKPSIESLNALADFFNVSVDYLLGRTDDPHNAEKKVIKEKTADLNDDETIFTYEGHQIPPEDLEYMKRLLRGAK